MNIFNEKGYLSIPILLKQGVNHILCTGARGTGKTYGSAEDCLITNPRPWIYMRRTKAELEAVYKSEKLNPFNGLNRNYHRNFGLVRSSDYTGIITDRAVDEDGKLVPVGEPLGICMALKSVAKIRGFDGSDFDTLVYDEFIPERHVEKIHDECTAFLNALETIGRNRELEGRPPLQVLMFANANRLDNEIYMGLGIVSKAERMKATGQTISIMRERDMMIVNIDRSPISEKKRETSLYKFAEGTEFKAMALDNAYMGEEDTGSVHARPIKEYNPIISVGELCIYRHKTNPEYYCTTKQSGNPPKYGTGEIELKRLRHDFRYMIVRYMDMRVFFENRTCEILFTRYFQIG